VIVLVYTWLARREEQQVLTQFGEEYRVYQQQIPMFIPRWGQWRRLASASRDRNGD
jgi:protein-S-isoprenylcysteine O-methyltransferase Ste14